MRYQGERKYYVSKKDSVNIPWWLVIAACFFSWPVGIILLILKFVLPEVKNYSSNHKNNSSQQNKNMYSQGQQNANIDYAAGYKNYINQQNAKAQSGKPKYDPMTGKRLDDSNSYNYTYTANNTAASGSQYSADNIKSNINMSNAGPKYKRVKKSAAAVLLTILGIMLAIPGAILGLDALVDIFRIASFTTAIPAFIQAGGFIGGSVVSLLLANVFKSRQSLFARYQTVIGKREAVYIPKLASITDVKYKKACSDLQKMIDKGYLGNEAYIDAETKNLILKTGAVPEKGPELNISQMFSGFAAKEEETADEGEGGNKEFKSLLKQIRTADDEIADEEVSEKIRRIEDITREIFRHIEDKPEKMPKIRTFMNYYLPTTLKLLKSYSQLEKLNVDTENINSARDNIEKILDMLVAGFEQQLDQLFKTEELDISADIDVLEQMMIKDGLAGPNDFDLDIKEDESEEDDDLFEVDDFNAFSDDLSGGAAMKKKDDEK